MQNLDRYEPVVDGVTSKEYCRHPAATELSLDVVARRESILEKRDQCGRITHVMTGNANAGGDLRRRSVNCDSIFVFRMARTLVPVFVFGIKLVVQVDEIVV